MLLALIAGLYMRSQKQVVLAENVSKGLEK